MCRAPGCRGCRRGEALVFGSLGAFRSPEAARGDMRRLTELSAQSLHVMELPVQGLILEQLRSRRVAPGIKKTVDSVDKRRSERLVQNVLHIPECHISTVFGLALLACSPWPLQS